MRRFPALFLFSMVATCLVAACDSASIVDPPVSPGSEETFDGKLGQRSPVAIVLVVDDAATMDAAQLRAQMVETVRKGLLSEVEERWRGSCGNADPAAWHPGDMRVLLARPSAPDGEALLTPLEIPSLAWITKRSTAEEVEAVVSATAEALEKRLAGAGELYRPLHTAKRAVELVTRARQPESEGEAALVASLPPQLLTLLVVASGRDDNDAPSVESLAPVAASSESTVWTKVVGPFNAKAATCETDDTSNTRLGAWGKNVDARFTAWPCKADTSVEGLLILGSADCSIPCHPKPLPVAPDGTVACRVYVDQTNLDRCEPERGHRDPDGKPELIDRQGTKLRRCEVNQLTGAALDACRTSLACPDCPSGFCATEVPELSHAQACEQGEYAWPVRHTGESIGAPGDWTHVVCTTTTTNN